MLFSRYASNLLKMCRFVNLDLRLSTDVRQMLYGVFSGFCVFRGLFLYQIKHLDGIFGFGTAKEVDGNGYHG